MASGSSLKVIYAAIAANLAIALLLQHGAKDDLNIRSAFWHMLSDAWVSVPRPTSRFRPRHCCDQKPRVLAGARALPSACPGRSRTAGSDP